MTEQPPEGDRQLALLRFARSQSPRKAVGGLDVSAVDEGGPGHSAAPLGLDFQEFEEALAGGYLEAVVELA